MRYVIAIVFAALGAFVVSAFVANHGATLLTRNFTFESPDGVATFHSSAFILLSLGGLIVGWIAGFALGGAFASDDADLDNDV